MADSDDDLLARGKKAYELCNSDPAQNRETYEADVRFVRMQEHWDETIKKFREDAGRPCLTIDKLGPVIRQVVNDARQNKPSIKAKPVDSNADPETAEIIDGLIRNIEYSSNADAAYDRAVECAVSGGFGYFRIRADYTCDDVFDQDLIIDSIPDPLNVHPDPNSTATDSSDWNVAFVDERLTKEDYEKQFGKDEEKIDWSSDTWKGHWLNDDGVLVTEWWEREEVETIIVKLADGRIFDKKDLTEDEDLATALEAGLFEIVAERPAKSYKVTQRIMSGAGVLKTTEWPGRYIPIIPVYGDEFWLDGVRYLRSLVHGALHAQRAFDVMRSVAVELFGMAPKVPYLLEQNALPDEEVENWNTAHTTIRPYLLYKGPVSPIRIPLDPGPAAGAINEALAAADDIKAITGIYDASLGQRSNETSGRAIMARQREGDVSTFHFIDNLRRAIRHAGRVLIDLIPHYYNTERVVRVIGEDGKEETAKINGPSPKTDPKTGQPIMRPEPGTGIMAPVMAMHDLTTGKYDVTVSSGPSFTTRREEAAYSMTEALRAYPQGAPIIMPELAKNLDWPGADKIAEKLEQQASQQLPPEVQQKIEQGMQELQKLKEENQQLKMDRSIDQEQLRAEIQAEEAKAAAEFQIEEIRIQSQERIARAKIESEARIAAYKAQLSAQAEAQRPIVQAAPRAA